MGWIISIVLLIAAAISVNSDLMIAAGLFAIAGSVEFLSDKKTDKKKEEDAKQ